MAQKTKIQKSFFTWLFNDSVDEDLPAPLNIGDEETEVKDEDHEKAEDSAYADLIKRIEALEAMNKKEEMNDEDKKEEVMKDSEDDEDLEDEDADGEYNVNDSLSGVISKAEILVPGIKLNKGDKPSLISLKRQTLTQAFLTDSLIKELSGGQDIKGMKPQAIDILFNSAVKLKAGMNNSSIKSTIINDATSSAEPFAAIKANFAKLNSK